MSALFNFDSLLRTIILVICLATYLKRHAPSLINKNTTGMASLFYKATVVGERLSPYVSFICLLYGLRMLKNAIFN